jgi:pSer/pThr/pTyr-binding forkhead associated (FHA) protein
VIGRHTSADLCLAYDPHVSAIHASITWTDSAQAHILNDLGSANGTFLDGVRLRRPALLNNGARIRFGLTELVYCSKLPMPGYVSTLARRVRSPRTGETRLSRTSESVD